MIQLLDIKTRTLGFTFCQPPKKSLPKSLTQKKSLQNFKPKKSPQIANFKPKKGLRTSPSLIYLSTPPGAVMLVHCRLPPPSILSGFPDSLLVPIYSLGWWWWGGGGGGHCESKVSCPRAKHSDSGTTSRINKIYHKLIGFY